jgi:hypothetical protein
MPNKFKASLNQSNRYSGILKIVKAIVEEYYNDFDGVLCTSTEDTYAVFLDISKTKPQWQTISHDILFGTAIAVSENIFNLNDDLLYLNPNGISSFTNIDGILKYKINGLGVICPTDVFISNTWKINDWNGAYIDTKTCELRITDYV